VCLSSKSIHSETSFIEIDFHRTPCTNLYRAESPLHVAEIYRTLYQNVYKAKFGIKIHIHRFLYTKLYIAESPEPVAEIYIYRTLYNNIYTAKTQNMYISRELGDSQVTIFERRLYGHCIEIHIHSTFKSIHSEIAIYIYISREIVDSQVAILKRHLCSHFIELYIHQTLYTNLHVANRDVIVGEIYICQNSLQKSILVKSRYIYIYVCRAKSGTAM